MCTDTSTFLKPSHRNRNHMSELNIRNAVMRLEHTAVLEASSEKQMQTAIKQNRLEELRNLLRNNAPVSPSTVNLAASRLAENPRSEECKEAIDLLLGNGWALDTPLDMDIPLLR
jgi:hypothetical protein